MDTASDAERQTARAQRCRTLSRRVEILAALSVAAQAAAIAAAAAFTSAAGTAAPALLLGAWVLWLGLQAANHGLVRCGRRAVRYAMAPRLVNRPEPALRAGLHFIINWSVIAATLGVAVLLGDPAWSARLAVLAAFAAPCVWIVFNALHRRMNRLCNLALSTAFAGALLAAAWLLLAGTAAP